MKRETAGYLDILVVGIGVVFMIGLFIIFGCTSAWCSDVNNEAIITEPAPTESVEIAEPIDMAKFESIKLDITPKPIVSILNSTNDIPEEPEIEEPIEEDLVEYYDVPLSEGLQDHIFTLCEDYNIEPRLVFAIIEKESNYRDWVKGDSGRSYGLMQIQKRWHVERMEKLGVTDLLNPYQNVTVGIDILAELLYRNNDVEWALMAYNGGASYANKLAAQGIVSKYAQKVLEISRGLERSVG